MEKTTVELLHITPLSVADIAISKCWATEPKYGQAMKNRMYRVGCKNKHASTLEHIVVSFDIDGISRACLQELARHRIQSLSVKSTRYTLKELLKAELLQPFLVSTGNVIVDDTNLSTLNKVRNVIKAKGLTMDEAKYMIPEAYRTSLVSTWNIRSLQNFLSLRTNRSALREIRQLATLMYKAVPDVYKFLLADSMYEDY